MKLCLTMMMLCVYIGVFGGVVWEEKYTGNTLPEEASPPWSKIEPKEKIGMLIGEKVKDGVLSLENGGEGAQRYFTISWVTDAKGARKSWRPGSELGSTAEITAMAQGEGSAPFNIGFFLCGFNWDGKYYDAALYLGVNGVMFQGKTVPGVKGGKMSTYRVTYDPVHKKCFTLYVDGVEKLTVALSELQPASIKNERIIWGASSEKMFNGKSAVKAIAWTNSGIFPPAADDPVMQAAQAAPKPAPKPAAATGKPEDIELARGILDKWPRWLAAAVPKTAKAPQVERLLDDPVWNDAAELRGLISSASYQVDADDTGIYLLWDESALYVGFRFMHPAPNEFKVSATGYTNSLWNKDDGFELMLSRDQKLEILFSLFGNPVGGFSDGYAQGSAFDVSDRFEWEYRTAKKADGYEAVVKIPAGAFQNLLNAKKIAPLPLAAGQVWTLGVTRLDMMPFKKLSELTQMWGSRYDGSRLGKIVFLADTRAVRIGKIGNLGHSRVGAAGEIVNRGAAAHEYTVEYEIFQAQYDLVAKRFNFMRTWDLIERFRKEGPAIEGIPLADQISESGHLGKIGSAYRKISGKNLKLKAEAGKTVPFEAAIEGSDGEFLIGLRVRDEAGNELYAQTMPLKVAPALKVSLTKRFLMKNGLEINTEINTVDGGRIKYDFYKAGKADLVLSAAGKAETGQKSICDFVDLSQLAAGEYCLTVTFSGTGADKELVREIKFNKPPVPEWYGNQIGITREVLPPWVPLNFKADQVLLWGRTYQFAAGQMLPQQIYSQQRPLLDSPMELLVKVSGTYRKLTAKTSWSEKAADRAVYEAECEDGSLTLKLKTRLEFDGLLTFDMSVRSALPVEELKLLIPVRKDIVSHWGGSYWGTELASADIAIKSGRIENFKDVFPDGKFRFAGLFQLGDDTGVLQWLAEEDRQWVNRDRRKAMALNERGNAQVLEIKFIDRAADCSKGRNFSWMIMPTPVKDISYVLNNDIITMNGLASGSPQHPYDAGALDKYYKLAGENNVTHFLTGGFGAPFHADVWVRDHNRRYLKDTIELGHLNKKKVYLYSLWGYDVNGKENGDFGDEMVKRPLQPCYPDTYWYNPEGPFQDFYMAGLKQTVEEFRIDGAYFDGFPVTGLLYDPLLDYGYIDENGDKHGKWPMKALRSWIKRVYAYMHLNNDGIVYQHTSGTVPNMAILSFCDFVCGGEEAPSQERLLNCWPLDEFFVKCYQRPYGLGYHVLWYDWWRRPVKENQALAVTLLYGQQLSLYGGLLYKKDAAYEKDRAPAVKIANILKTFKPAQAQWHPFWKKQNMISVPEPLKASFYLYPGEKALIFVSNLYEQDQTAAIGFNFEAMGFKADQVILSDPILNTEIKPEGQSVRLEVKGERYRILSIRKK